jgi:hypothetical protein
MRFELLIIWLAISWGCASPAFAGWGTEHGDEERLWEANFLIVARVIDVRAIDRKIDPEDDDTHLLLLEPLLTLAGSFDPSQQSELRVRLCVADHADSVGEAPPKGSTILVVIYHGEIAGDVTRPALCIPTARCLFMPDDAALVVLKDAADKRILETVRKVRAARGAKKNTTRSSK